MMKKTKKIEIAILVVMFLLSFMYPNFLTKYRVMSVFNDLLKMFL
jgi:hypothetical protein